MVPGATALIFNDANEILLGRRTDNGRWALIGGAVDPGESPAQAAIREALEETGVRAIIERVSGVYTAPVVTYPNGDIAQYVITAFRCRAEGGSPHAADEESSEVRYFPLDALPPDLSPAHPRCRRARQSEARDVRLGLEFGRAPPYFVFGARCMWRASAQRADLPEHIESCMVLT